MTMTNEHLFLIVFFVLAALVIGVCIDIFRLLRKEGRRASDSTDFSKNEIFLRISENFKKQLEELIGEEIKKNIGEFKKEFQKTSEEIIKNYKSQFEGGNQEIQKVISESSQQIPKETKKISEALSNELAQKFSQIYQSTKETINKRTSETEKEIENYKKERFKETDRKIYQMIGEVAKKTTGKAIDLSDHEKLVMEALEKAKREIF